MKSIRGSILITDDESNVRLMLRTALESEGYAVSEATDGQAALEAVQRQKPDLMVLDLSMPVLDGFAVLEQMKSLARTARPRVVVLTAYGSIPAAVKACRLGASDFVEKPITPSTLRRTIAEVMMEEVVDPDPALEVMVAGYERVIDQVRGALRLAEYADAETMLIRAAEIAQHDPAYYNLMGIIYESQKKLRLATKFFGRSLDVKADYEPARMNLRRVMEMRSFGRSSIPVMLNNSTEDEVWMARLPE